MFVHVHNNILNNINLPDVVNQLADRKNKQTLRDLSQNYLIEW